MCHLIVYKAHKIEINRFYIVPLEFYNQNNKLQLKLSFYSLILGLVLPNFDIITSKEKKIVFLSLITAPIMHLLLIILGISIYCFFIKNFGLNMIIINIIMLLSTFLENDNVIGDSLAAYYIYTSNNKADKFMNNYLKSQKLG